MREVIWVLVLVFNQHSIIPIFQYSSNITMKGESYGSIF